jgi:uncharacterized repeat protein (TIGR01451 family)
MHTLMKQLSLWLTDTRRHINLAAGALLLGASSCASLTQEWTSADVGAPYGSEVGLASRPIVGAAQLTDLPAPSTTRAQNPAEEACMAGCQGDLPHITQSSHLAEQSNPYYPEPGPVRSVAHEVTTRDDVHLAQGGLCPQPLPYSPVCQDANCGYAYECRTQFPDEYICDGGDKDIPVHYFEYQRHGLNFEDTVAEYVDSNGEPQVKPSSRVCVYAPRFASVRTIDVSHVDFTYDRLAGHHDGDRLVGFDNELRPDVETQTDQPIGLDRRDSAGGLIADVADDNLTKVEWIGGNIQVNRLWEDIGFVRDGRFHQEDEARIAMAIQVAHDWSHDLYPIIMADTLGGGIVEASFRAADMTGVHDPRTPGDLRIVKLCEQDTAQPGDVINFVIRYDNVGGRELTAVRILDNLSPRLELVPGSVTFDRAGTVEVQDNGAGSQLIVFELDEALPGETGGVLSFQCLVR